MSLQPLSRPALLAVGDGGDFYGLGWSGAPQRAVGSLGCRRAELNPWEWLSGVLPPCPVEPWVLPIPVPAAFGPALVPSLSEPSASAFPQCHLAATSPRLGHWVLDTHPWPQPAWPPLPPGRLQFPGGRRSIPPASPAPVPGCGAPSGAGTGGAAARRLPSHIRRCRSRGGAALLTGEAHGEGGLGPLRDASALSQP